MGGHNSKGAKYRNAGVTPPLAIRANGRMRLGSFKRGSSKKQREVGRSSSPVSDVSTNSTVSHLTPAHGLSNHQPQSRQLTPMYGGGAAPTSNGGVSKRHPTSPAISSNKRLHLSSSPPVAKCNQDKSVGTPAEMKTPLVRKPTSRRIEKHKLSRDHNRFAGVNKPLIAGNDGGVPPAGVTSSAPAPAPTATPAATTPAATTTASLNACALEAAKKRVRQLEAREQTCVIGFDAMTAVVAHLVNHYDALSARRMKLELEKATAARNEASLTLDEMAAKLQRVQEQLANSEAETLSLKAEMAEMKQTHTDELAEAENKYKELTKTSEEAVLQLSVLHAAEMEASVAKHESALNQLQIDSKTAYDQLQERLVQTESDYQKSKAHTSTLYDSMEQDKETRIQVTAGRCRVLEEEAESLRAVLEIRLKELHDLRHRNDILSRDVEEMDAVERKASALQARVEDLELQLTLKKNEQRQLANEFANVADRLQQESIGNKRLSQCNEELTYKIKNKQKIINLLSKSHVPETTDNSFQKVTERNAKSFSGTSYENDVFPAAMSDLACDGSSSPNTVTSFYERSDSVSWIFEMDDETPEDAAQKILQKKSASTNLSPIVKRCSTTPRRQVDDVNMDFMFDMCASAMSTPNPTSGSETFLRDGRLDNGGRKENGMRVEFQNEPPKCMTSSDSSQSSHDEIEKPLAVLPMVLPASSSSDLVLLATQKPPVPKDAGGEAMVSVETSEEDNSVEPSDDDSSSDIQ